MKGEVVTYGQAFDIAMKKGLIEKHPGTGMISANLRRIGKKDLLLLIMAQHYMYERPEFRLIPDRFGFPMWVENEKE